MFKKTMTFDDFDGNEVTQTFYFNYKKKEVVELLQFGKVQQFAEPGKVYTPLEEMMAKLTTPREEQGLSQQENNQQAYDIFQSLILDAYGEKGADNVTFVKNWKTRNYFQSHVAFDDLVFEFLGDEKMAAEFFEQCLPPKVVAQARREMEEEERRKAQIPQMVEEAAERQKDPETRVEPGPQQAPMLTDGLTDAEILAANPIELTKAQLVRAMGIRNKS